VAAGDAAAMRACLDQYSGLVWSLARRLAPSTAEAEDAVQEVFIALWKNAERFDPAVAAESTFVAMIARRRLIDRARVHSRKVQPGAINENVAEQTRPNPAALTDEAALAARAISELSPEQQRTVQLSICRGLSHEQISQATGLPLGTVKTHIRRGLIRVREILEARSFQGGAA